MSSSATWWPDPRTGEECHGSTVIEFKNSNCSWCINSTVAQLRAMTPVNAVHLHADTGCIEVAHDSADPSRLVEAVCHNLHRWILADDGERVIVDVDAHPSVDCPDGQIA